MSEKSKINHVIQPKFYKNFHCIGGDCPVTCCYGWRIDFSKSEVEKLKNSDCPDQIKELINTSFEPYKDGWEIKFDNNGKCPFQNDEGWCSIQKELGEDYLAEICRSYPRISFLIGNRVLRSCNLSCIHVLSMICSDEDSMNLEILESTGKKLHDIITDTNQSVANYPILKYRADLFFFFYDILANKDHSIETSIVLGGMAAQKIDEIVKQRKYHLIPDVLITLKSQLNNPEQIAKIESFKPNLSLKANFSAAVLKLLKSNIYMNIFENGIPNEEKYNNGMEEFKKHFNGTPGFLRNIALNLYISNKMPVRKANHSIFENYCFFVAEIAVIKFLMPTIASGFSSDELHVESAIAFIDRRFTHDDSHIDVILELMKHMKITTPAYLLGIIK